MIENNDIKHVNLSHVFNVVILYFTITDLFRHRRVFPLVKQLRSKKISIVCLYR